MSKKTIFFFLLWWVVSIIITLTRPFETKGIDEVMIYLAVSQPFWALFLNGLKLLGKKPESVLPTPAPTATQTHYRSVLRQQREERMAAETQTANIPARHWSPVDEPFLVNIDHLSTWQKSRIRARFERKELRLKQLEGSWWFILPPNPVATN